jgi:hypothetical protein
MKNYFILFSCFIFIVGNLHGENLTIQGNLDVQGNILNLGSWEGQTNEAGLSLNYTDYPDDEYGEFRFSLNRPTTTWLWEHLGPNNSWKPAMKLEESHVLYLYDGNGQGNIALNPIGSSIFQNSVTINGNNNLMPNQTLFGDGSVLTRKLGDGRYVMKWSDKTALGYATATGNFSTALGGDSLASGQYSIAGGQSIATGAFSVALGEDNYATGQSAVALGNNAQAKGNTSFAVGYYAQAFGLHSVAMGENNLALGANSFAMGLESTAYNYLSFAMGETVEAKGYNTVALGSSTIAQGKGQVVLGRYNLAQGNPTNWVATDDLFIVGNGTAWNQRSNAFVVKKNGDAVVKGNATVQGYSYLDDVSTDGINAGGDLTVWGVSEMMGGAYVGGDLQVTGKLYLQAQGDIPMGQFNQ